MAVYPITDLATSSMGRLAVDLDLDEIDIEPCRRRSSEGDAPQETLARTTVNLFKVCGA